MEKRVFSLSGAWQRGGIILNGVGLTFVAFLNFWRGNDGWRWLWLAMLFIIPCFYLCYYLNERFLRIEVSDEGFVLVSWGHKPVRFNWDAITKIELFEKPSFPRFIPFFRVFTGGDSRGRIISIPAYSACFEDLAKIMRTRLPDKVVKVQ